MVYERVLNDVKGKSTHYIRRDTSRTCFYKYNPVTINFALNAIIKKVIVLMYTFGFPSKLHVVSLA